MPSWTASVITVFQTVDNSPIFRLPVALANLFVLLEIEIKYQSILMLLEEF